MTRHTPPTAVEIEARLILARATFERAQADFLCAMGQLQGAIHAAQSLSIANSQACSQRRTDPPVSVPLSAAASEFLADARIDAEVINDWHGAMTRGAL